ncbi:MAG: sigma-70 family RNA polymerase sigma factor [Bacteroidota bacterium]
MDQFKRIVQEYHPILFKIGRSYTDNEFDFQELYQEMLIQLWRAMPNFNEQSKLSTFIYRVALNTALTFQRGRDRRRRRFLFGKIPKELPSEDQVITKQENEQRIDLLYEAIRSLKPENRSLILLSLEGHSYEQIAEILGISSSNVGVKLLRTRKQLSKLLNAKGYANI